MGRQLRLEATEDPHAQAIWHLLWDDLDRGISTLRQAELEELSARLETDLAAAYLLRSHEPGRASDMILALATADRALRRSPSPAALFNRGLALERLHLYDEATAAWSAYLEMETDPGWRGEAQDHLRRNRAASRRYDRTEIESALLGAGPATSPIEDVVAMAPSLSRRVLLVTLLEEVARGGPGTDRINRIATAVAAVTSDPSLVEEVALACTEKSAREKLYSLYARARHYYDDFEIELAYETLLQAHRQISLAKGRPRGVVELWIRYYEAVCQYWFGELERARRSLLKLVSEVPYNWLDLKGHVHWMLGLIVANQGSPTTALEHYRQASAAFEQGSFRQEAAFLRVLRAEELLELGDAEAALEQLVNALADAGAILRPKLLRGLYGRAAEVARRFGSFEVALYFENRTLRVAERARDSVVAAEGYYLRSLTRLKMGDVAGARQDLEASRQWQESIGDAFARRMVEAGIRLAESRLPEPSRQGSLESLSAAIASVEDQGASAVLPTMLRERARRRSKLRDTAGALSDLEHAARLLVQHAIARPGELATHWKRGQIRDVFGSLSEVLESDGRSEQAVAYSLVGRSLELGKIVPSLDRDLEELRRSWKAVDHLSAMIALRLVEDRLFVWLAHDGQSQSLSLEFPIAEAEALVATVRRDRGGPEGDMALARVARRLEPLLAAVRATSARRLLWIQDVPLLGLPVVALHDPLTGQALVRQYSVVTVQHLGAVRRPSERDWTAMAFLGVGDPELPSDSMLSQLRSARREIERISGHFERPTTLIGDAATKKAILRHAPGAAVLHFAAHALTGEAGPHRSRLLLTGSGETGVLWGHEIQALDLRAVELVVLSSCHTSSLPGLHSLAQSFLGAGAAAVVGSFWEVEDQSTSELISAFYDHLVQRASPEDALRRAQLAAFEAGRPWNEWAAFQLISNWN